MTIVDAPGATRATAISVSGSSRSCSSSPPSITPAAPPSPSPPYRCPRRFTSPPSRWAGSCPPLAGPMSSARFPAARCSTSMARAPSICWSITLWAVFTMAQAFVSSLAIVPIFTSLFLLRLALGFANAQLSGQCPHRRQLVPSCRARHRQRHLQLLAIFLAGGFRAADGLAGAGIWLAQRLPGDGRHRPCRGGAVLGRGAIALTPQGRQQARI